MLILIRTPFYKNSTAIPHLVEHCVGVGHGTGLTDFFTYSNVDATQFPSYAEFFVPDNTLLDGFMKLLRKSPSQNVYRFEKRVLRAELEKSPYKQRLFEKIIRTRFLLGFSHNSASRTSFKDVSWYHETYYRNGRILVADDTYRTFRMYGFEFQTILKPENFSKPKNLGTIRLDGFSNIMFQFENSPIGLFSAAITENLVSTYYLWSQRFEEGSHSTDSPYFFPSEMGILLTVPKETLPFEIPTEFIEKFLTWYSQKGAWKELALSVLLFGEMCESEDFSIFISQLSCSNFDFLLSEQKT